MSIAEPDRADLVVVGAGIVGLAHAVDAVHRGCSVTVVERNPRALGASVRNFGHVCATAQDGAALDYAMAARDRWLALGAEADLGLRESGTVVVARHDDEYAVLEEFAARRDGGVELLDAAAVLDRAPVCADPVVGGAWLPLDLRIDPRRAAASLAGWLADRGVRFQWSTSVVGIGPGTVTTTRGELAAGAVVVAVGHDVDRLFPAVAESAGVTRCVLRMLRVAPPAGRRFDPAVLSGLSLLRYDGFRATPSVAAVAARYEQDEPDLLAAGVNLMFTQRDDGTLTIGDTHHYTVAPEPFEDEPTSELVLAETARFLGVDRHRLDVHERWRGVYAAAPEPFLVEAPQPGVRVVSVTSGIGMTTALGLAPRVLDGLT